jgi:hypothetical protein
MHDRIAAALRRSRRYAGFFDWPDRAVKESAIVQRLSESLQAAGEPGFMSVEAWPRDPPDCVATTEAGDRIAVEVTELVDQRMARLGRRVLGRHHDWTPPEAISRLQTIISKKDLHGFGLREYARVLLVIHTDEMLLRSYAGDAIWEAVAAHTFRKPTNIDEVIVLVSYDPRVQTYPYTRLRLALGGGSKLELDDDTDTRDTTRPQ